MSADLLALIEQFKEQSVVCEMHRYELKQRVLADHCEIDSAGVVVRLNLKPDSEVPIDLLQNPSDPDATYDGHKDHCDHVQVMETYSTTEDPVQKEQTLRLITHISVEPAHVSDTYTLLPALEDTQARGLSEKNTLADAACGSDDNVCRARTLGVEVVAPSMKGNSTKLVDLSEFAFDDSGGVAGCPQGHAPQKLTHKQKKSRYVAGFAVECCRSCPRVADCLLQQGKKYYYLHYHSKHYRMALRRRLERNHEFIDRYRWRAGVEAAMSEYATLTGVKRLRVRGMAAVRYAAVLKAAALNLMQAVRVRRARIRARLGASLAYSQPLRVHFLSFKERICRPHRELGGIFSFRPAQPTTASHWPLTFYESIKFN